MSDETSGQPLEPQPITCQIGPAEIERAMKGTGRLLFWIAGLSVLNTILFIGQANVMMLGGLGMTLIVDVFASVMHQQAIGFGIDLMMASFYVALGMWAGRGSRMAFVLGMGVYAVDALILAYFADWFNVAFHVYFLFGLNQGMQSNAELQAMLRRMKA